MIDCQDLDALPHSAARKGKRKATEEDMLKEEIAGMFIIPEVVAVCECRSHAHIRHEICGRVLEKEEGAGAAFQEGANRVGQGAFLLR